MPSRMLDASKAGASGLRLACPAALDQWKTQDDLLQVFVELRDVNYPGSTYTLNYDPATDRLEGLYFQAVQQQNFKVLFIRK